MIHLYFEDQYSSHGNPGRVGKLFLHNVPTFFRNNPLKPSSPSALSGFIYLTIFSISSYEGKTREDKLSTGDRIEFKSKGDTVGIQTPIYSRNYSKMLLLFHGAPLEHCLQQILSQ
jgi:hypothetical protein